MLCGTLYKRVIKKEVYTFLGQDFLKNYSLRDNLVSEDCQMSCFVVQRYKK